jgi:glycosyltransferase involved in cell wall biosynthesis
MRIAIVSDAWRPQINGVVTTLGKTAEAAEQLGHTIEVISADGSPSIACPSYPEIRLAIRPGRVVRERLRRFAPEMIHVATEGPLGLAARNHCVRSKLPFTTSYHTQFPDYAQARWRVPASWGYAYLRWFHRPAVRTLVGTETVRTNLQAWGFNHLVPWSRGVDTVLFRPDPQARAMAAIRWPRPIMLYSGRVAVEKNLEAFLRLQLPGTKLIVGDGPARAALQSQYPDAVFLGYRFGAELAWHMAAADVFVFPSRTDTFGIVMLESMACGVPVAAYPVQGPLDVVRNGVTGILDEDLATAVQRALRLESAQCRAFAQLQSWERCTRQFIGHLAPAVERPAPQRPRAPEQGTAVAQLKKG